VNTKCIACKRTFVDKINDKSTECLRHTTVCVYGEMDMHSCEEIGYICQACYRERKRLSRVRSRAERELTPDKKGINRKEKQ